MAVAAIEKTMLKHRWKPAWRDAPLERPAAPSHRSAGVSAAQTYMPAIQPTNTYVHGTGSPR